MTTSSRHAEGMGKQVEAAEHEETVARPKEVRAAASPKAGLADGGNRRGSRRRIMASVSARRRALPGRPLGRGELWVSPLGGADPEDTPALSGPSGRGRMMSGRREICRTDAGRELRGGAGGRTSGRGKDGGGACKSTAGGPAPHTGAGARTPGCDLPWLGQACLTRSRWGCHSRRCCPPGTCGTMKKAQDTPAHLGPGAGDCRRGTVVRAHPGRVLLSVGSRAQPLHRWRRHHPRRHRVRADRVALYL